MALDRFPLDGLDLQSDHFWERWQERWSALGDTYRAQSDEATSMHGKRQHLMSAAACYHWAEFMYFSDTHRKSQLREQVRDCFAGGLHALPFTTQTGTIVSDGVAMPYYFMMPTTKKRGHKPPCIIMSNGLDSVTEVEVFSFAELFLSRGIATLLFDGPGQGINLGHHPLPLSFERPVEKLIAWLTREGSISMDQLGFFGISFGGYFALRVAQHLDRAFQCVINVSGGPYLAPFDTLPRRLKKDFQYAFMQDDPTKMQELFDQASLSFHHTPRVPILSIHGVLDDIFPIAGLRHLDRQCKEKHRFIQYEKEAHVCLNHINAYSVVIGDWAKSYLSS